MRHCYLIVLLLAFGLSACVKSKPEDLIRVDKDFSAFSKAKGMKQAFLEYAADSAVLLQKDIVPIVGKEAIYESFESFSDTGFILTWEPLFADVSASGDLGYTYGLFTSHTTSGDLLGRGKYVTIWKKQADGTWKYMLDGGNEGP